VNERMQITPNIALSICEDCGAAIPVDLYEDPSKIGSRR
jgi:hypothetical protein